MNLGTKKPNNGYQGLRIVAYSSFLFNMLEFKLPFVEGVSINRPPIFSGLNYALGKIRMKIFMKSIDMGIWDVVVNGTFVHMQVVKDETVKNPWSKWSKSEKEKGTI